MRIKKKKVSLKPYDMTKEILRAADFFRLQISRGWSVEETMEQINNCYGYSIQKAVRNSLSRVLS